MSKLEQLHAFINVVEENSFAKAGRKLGLSTAAISRQVSALEAELGIQLLHRSTRYVGLTDRGESYYQHCKQALLALAEAENDLAKSQSEATGLLTITSNRYFASTLLIPRLAEFMSLHPKLAIKLELAERFPDLLQENIDILFGVTLEGSPELVRKRIGITRYLLCASPHYLEQMGHPKTPADLTKHRYIAHSMRKPMDKITFKDGKEMYLQPMLWLNDTKAMKECALHHMGIVNLHDYEVEDELRNKTLIEILPSYRETARPVYLYYQQSRYLQPKIRRFIDFYQP
jgi:DNA-binding transcriptional LysR family regulator